MRPFINPKDFFLLKADSRAKLRFLLRFAAEAPSSHNTQPWRFKVMDDVIEVYGDESRALPLSDPAGREFFISIGCAIENILVAADYYGLPIRLVYFPDPEKPQFVARISFDDLKGSATSLDDGHHLIYYIQKRHANRETFQKDIPLSANISQAFQAFARPGYHVRVITDGIEKEGLVTMVSNATYAAFKDKGFCEELSHWIKPSWPRHSDGMPGYNLGIPWPLSFIVPLAIRHGNVADEQRKMVEKMLAPVSAFVIISAEGDTPRDHVETGVILEEIWLTATREGIKMGLFGAPIEIGDFYAGIKKILGLPYRPQICCRLGYAEKIPKQSPRRSVDDAIES